MVSQGFVLDESPRRISCPIAFPSGQKRRARVSSTTATGGLSRVRLVDHAATEDGRAHGGEIPRGDHADPATRLGWPGSGSRPLDHEDLPVVAVAERSHRGEAHGLTPGRPGPLGKLRVERPHARGCRRLGGQGTRPTSTFSGAKAQVYLQQVPEAAEEEAGADKSTTERANCATTKASFKRRLLPPLVARAPSFTAS